jgi:hypothetical protein
MSEKQLNRLQKANRTKTTRAIVRACYPSSVRTVVGVENIGFGFRQAIHGKGSVLDYDFDIPKNLDLILLS